MNCAKRTRQSHSCNMEFLSRVFKFLLLILVKVTGCEVDPENPLSEIVRVLLCHVFLKYGRQSKFSSYNFRSKDIRKRALIAPESEKKVEFPMTQLGLEKQGPQELILTGMRTNGEFIVIQFSRSSRRRAQINIVIRDIESRTFCLPDNETRPSNLDISHGNKYQAGGLRIQCIEPMRKWRIAFNGILKNAATGEEVFVKLALLWFTMSDVMDWSSSVPSKQLMKFCLDTTNARSMTEALINIDLCRNHLNGYEQSGYCVGEAQFSTRTDLIKPKEWKNELHLRGNFIRIRSPIGNVNQPHIESYSHDIAYSKKGHCVQISHFRFSNNKTITFGSFLSTPGFKDPIEVITNSIGADVDGIEVLNDLRLKFATFELTHELSRSERNNLQRSESFVVGEKSIDISWYDARIDEVESFGVSVRGKLIPGGTLAHNPLNILDYGPVPSKKAYVVRLTDTVCKNSDWSGGKGSSLAVLHESTKRLNEPIIVPLGVVITCEAFREFSATPSVRLIMDDLQKVLEFSSVEAVRRITDRCVERFHAEEMPKLIAQEILVLLRELFPDTGSRRFAIRSSCVGEDSEEISAAGQMESFLGVMGENEIIKAVLKCWASQFSHIAVEYKRRYGLSLISDMAVVIMEMVPADSAGVMFTCDPMTGDPSVTCITSNFGLGQSVVSASVEPDTFKVRKSSDGFWEIEETVLGRKGLKILMDEQSGTRVETIEGGLDASISPEQVQLLARVGQEVELCFGDWRDIEWAFSEDKLFILQARPVTFMDKPTDEEVSHDFEACSRSENASFSKANVGEVLNGAISPLGIDVINKVCGVGFTNLRSKSCRERRCAVSPYCYTILSISKYQYFFEMSQAFRSFVPDPSNTRQVESLMLNLCGRIIDDAELYEDMNDKTDKPSYIPYLERIREDIEMRYLGKFIHRFYDLLTKMNSRHPRPGMTVEELFDGFIHSLHVTIDTGSYPHMTVSNGSTLWSSRIVEFLQSCSQESMQTIFGDMSKLLASANDVVSCNVPRSFENLARVIASEIGRENFLQCSGADAEKLLLDQKRFPKAARAYNDFLRDHKHRGYNEFDVYRKSWQLNATPVTDTLKAMLQNDQPFSEKQHESIWSAVNGINCKLTFWQKIRLACIVSFARTAVGVRENTKSLWIWCQNVSREWLYALGKQMKREGKLPDEELVFFFTLAELFDLIQSRNPAAISRALRRQRLFPNLVDLKFPEYFRGTPKAAPEELPTFEDGVVQMEGFPMSRGRVQAKARVITKLEEANQIKRGEVLITYATDIGWSPYFPLLGGIVTELGGLMSHGAVVAREYGLPCIVGLNGATRVFKSGDTVLLDGTKGLLVRVKEA